MHSKFWHDLYKFFNSLSHYALTLEKFVITLLLRVKGRNFLFPLMKWTGKHMYVILISLLSLT